MNSTNSSMGMSPQLCTTPACIHAASKILYNLAPNYTQIDPCTDFDQYTCNGWVERTTAPDGTATIDVLTLMQDDIRGQVRKMLEGPYPSESNASWISVNYTEDQTQVDKANFEKLQTVYATCMNYTEQASAGLGPLTEFVAQVAELFPANPTQNSSAAGMNRTYDHSEAMGKTLTLFESLGIETTQLISIRQDDEDPDKSMLAFLPPTKSDIPTEPAAILPYIQVASALLAEVHPANITVARAAELMLASIEMQAKVAQFLVSAIEEITGGGGNASSAGASAASLNTPKTSIDEIQQLAPQLNYKAVIEALAPQGYDASRILFLGASYYGNLSLIASTTPPEVIQTFFIWKAISTMASHVVSPLTDAYNDFVVASAGGNPNDGKPRWKECITLLDYGVDWIASNELFFNTVGPSGLTWSLARFFVEEHYSQEAHDLAQELLDALEESFIERMQNNTWATAEVKAAAVDKAQKIRNKIAFPMSPNTTDPYAILRHYAKVEVNGTYVETVFSLVKNAIGYAWSTLDQPYDREKFIFTTLDPNAYYNPPLNEIAMLAGIQQFPLFDVDFPTYLAYGAMGSISGHEIIHGFDNQGRLYDARGNLTLWWDNATIAAFTEKTKCFVEQYSNYTVTGPNGTQFPINGQSTLNENIADSGGIVNSFNAWKKVEKKMGRPASNLPGLDNFTQEQLFFIQWGQMWCSDISPAGKLRIIETNPHSPNEARIAVAVQNSAEFKKAFSCPVKEPTCELY